MMRADAEEERGQHVERRDNISGAVNSHWQVFGLSMYAVVAGILMLILVGIVHYTGILPE